MTQNVSKPLSWHQAIFQQWFERHHSARAAHAYLLIAPEDTGGEQLVQAMAASLLCDTPTMARHACGECAGCALMAAFSHPDLRVLRPSIMNMAHPVEELRPEKPSKEITIDDVRALDNMVNQTSHRGGQRVVVLYPAHKLNRNAANALLKTLEEPPANTVFILLAHDVRQLLPTIVSRCQLINVSAPTTDEALAYLNAIKPNPNWSNYLQQENGAVMRVAELIDTDYFAIQNQWIQALAKGSKLDVVGTAAAFEKHIADANKARLAGEEQRTVDMAVLMTWLQRLIYDLGLVVQNGGQARYYPQQMAALSQLTRTHDHAFLLKLHDFAAQLATEKRVADHPLNIRSWVEKLLLQYVQLFS